MREMIRYGFILALTCVVASGLLAGVNALTKSRIIAQAQAEEEASLKEVLPQAEHFEAVKSGEEVLYYKAYDENGQFIGVAFKAKAKGYSGIIETMVGMDKKGMITAIKILSQNETPGLGSRVTEVVEEITLVDVLKGKTQVERPKKPWFCEQFKGKKIIHLDKEVPAITGATISSEAVIKAVKEQGLKILSEATTYGTE